jgi:hypothetical protein
MGSQNASAVPGVLALALATACGNAVSPQISPISTPADVPDLSLQGVALARLSEGRIVARGTADRLDYRRAGARLQASRSGGVIHPEPGSRLATLGSVRFVADRVDGEIANRKGVASGAVRVDAERGDVARTERIYYDGDFLRGDTRVTAAGPGYRVEGNGLVARTDGSVIQLTDRVKGQLQMEARR